MECDQRATQSPRLPRAMSCRRMRSWLNTRRGMANYTGVCRTLRDQNQAWPGPVTHLTTAVSDQKGYKPLGALHVGLVWLAQAPHERALFDPDPIRIAG
jgi:hypothetical protein